MAKRVKNTPGKQPDLFLNAQKNSTRRSIGERISVRSPFTLMPGSGIGVALLENRPPAHDAGTWIELHISEGTFMTSVLLSRDSAEAMVARLTEALAELK